MFLVINRSITDRSLSLEAKNQIMFSKRETQRFRTRLTQKMMPLSSVFPLFTLELHLVHDYSPSRQFPLELLQNTLASVELGRG